MKAEQVKNIHQEQWKPPPPLPSCITNDDMEISYKPKNEAAETEDKHSRLAETQNVDMTYRTVRGDLNLDLNPEPDIERS